MSAITWDDVEAVAPELEDVPEAAQTLILAYANTALNPAMFKAPALALARAYLAAHYATISLSGGDVTAGPVISEETGGIKRTYALVDGSDIAAGGTTYWNLFKFLVRTSKARMPRVI